MSFTVLFLHSIFMFINHPLIMMVIMIPATIMYAILLTNLMKTSWYSMVLILILIGAMLILFMYMASLSPNEMMNPPIFSPFILLLMMMMYKHNMIQEPSTMMNNSIKLFSQIQWGTTTMLVIYLLLTMIVVVFITNINEGPLRST
uniref:NADH dehydrogenase subunit 6 n=1 Tax=Nothopuga sp. 1 LP-2008 TaxID=504482 RepID=A9LI71_9ARAC|nr:NADH dehydrogenase subunit 6 [Nothopuga sp. 1 LP-2008]ABS71900.1 NADH dehydrogenase subunit 6 [Nothopuga sp. 1 LP-2008]